MALHVQDAGEQIVQIVPIAIRYSDPIPHWRSHIRVKIGQPLSSAPYRDQPLKQASRILTQDLQATLDALNASLYRELHPTRHPLGKL
jgi:1-acyl-sn-glycerol-3-phosphate acyltransferase